MSIATLSIDLDARLAKLEQGFAKAEREAEKRTAAIVRSISKISDAAAGLGSIFAGVFSVGAISQWLRTTAADLDALNDAADATGASISKLGGLEELGLRTGTSFDTVTGILVKFNQVLAQSVDPASGASRALESIGLNAAELRRLDPADALEKTARALSAFADDGNKARLVQELFGKSVREAAPFLKDLAEFGVRNAEGLEQQARAAEEFNRTVASLQSNLTTLSRTVFGAVVPALDEMLKRFNKRGVLGTFADDLQLKLNEGLAQIANEKLAERVARLQELQKVAPTGGSMYTKAEVASLRREIAELQREATAANNKVKALLNGGKEPEAPAPKGDPTRAALRSNEGYGSVSVAVPTKPTPLDAATKARRAEVEKTLAGLGDLEGMLAASLAKQVDALDKELGRIDQLEQRRLDEIDRFAEQLQVQTADLSASLLTDERARGQAQIDIDRQVLQRRLDELQLYGEERARLQQRLDEYLFARQAQLEEQLKPQWLRLIDAWSDTTAQMARSFDDLMEGVVTKTEDTLARFIRTGKLSITDLANFVSDAIARMVAQQAAVQLFKFAGDAFIGATGGFALAKGGVISNGALQKFAVGGVVGTPTYFPMAGGKTGLMGEAGPEAIMPLTRGPDGKLGVQASGQGGVSVVMNVQSGVSRAELAALVPALTAQIKAELTQSMRRPGSAVRG